MQQLHDVLEGDLLQLVGVQPFVESLQAPLNGLIDVLLLVELALELPLVQDNANLPGHPLK